MENVDMKEEALKLADELDWHWDNDCRSPAIINSAGMIRKLVAELDKQTYKADLLENRLRVITGKENETT